MRFHLFVASLLFFTTLDACQNGYFGCVQKCKDAKVMQGESLSIPVQGHKRLIFSSTPPKNKTFKYDPFLHLYLVEDLQNFPFPFDINMRLQLGTAALNARTFSEGRLVEEQLGLNRLGVYKSALKSPAVVTSSCCSLEGIVTPKGMIDKHYLQHFLQGKKLSYGDIGIRVEQRREGVRVIASNPYFGENRVQNGDVVLAFDNKKVRSAAELMRRILFAKIGSKHTLTIKRGTKKLNCDALVHQRLGGGYISDTFLEYQGLYFDDSLHVKKVKKGFGAYGIAVGDRLLQVNGHTVHTQKDIREQIQKNRKITQLLLERKNFQFFVNIK